MQIQGRSRFLFNLPAGAGYITRTCDRRWLATQKSDEPITFSRSKARTYRIVDDGIMTSDREMKRGAYAVPIGMLSFAVLVYMGFIREENVRNRNSTTDKVPEATSVETDR